MDDHLVPLGGDWALRRDFAVRSAGFPVSGLDVFGADDERTGLREIAGDPAFREAVTWQNRGVARDRSGRPDQGGWRAEQAKAARGDRCSLLAALLLEERHDRVLRPARVGRRSRRWPGARTTLERAGPSSERSTSRPGVSSGSCRRSPTIPGCHLARGRRRTPGIRIESIADAARARACGDRACSPRGGTQPHRGCVAR